MHGVYCTVNTVLFSDGLTAESIAAGKGLDRMVAVLRGGQELSR